MLDLWVHTIYNDGQVQGSELGPLVYFRNCTGNPLTNFSDLALRWGISKATVSHTLKKLQDKEYLSPVSFTGRHGIVVHGTLSATVTDDGPGFSEKLLRKKTDLFYTKDTSGKHLGLGLAVSRVLCQKHGGTIELSNQPPHGACVKATITIKQ